LDRPPDDGWSYLSGHIDEAMLASHMPRADSGSIVLMCGPPPMLEYACHPNLERLGFQKDQLYSF